jgi:hypothetical protein
MIPVERSTPIPPVGGSITLSSIPCCNRGEMRPDATRRQFDPSTIRRSARESLVEKGSVCQFHFKDNPHFLGESAIQLHQRRQRRSGERSEQDANRDLVTHFEQNAKPVCIQAFVAQATVETSIWPFCIGLPG